MILRAAPLTKFQLRFGKHRSLLRSKASVDQRLQDAELTLGPVSDYWRRASRRDGLSEAPPQGLKVLARSGDQDALQWHHPASTIISSRNLLFGAGFRHGGAAHAREHGCVLETDPGWLGLDDRVGRHWQGTPYLGQRKTCGQLLPPASVIETPVGGHPGACPTQPDDNEYRPR